MKTRILFFVVFFLAFFQTKAQIRIHSFFPDSIYVLPGQFFYDDYRVSSEDSLLSLRTRLSSDLKESFLVSDMRLFYGADSGYTIFSEDDSYSRNCNLYVNSRERALKTSFIFGIDCYSGICLWDEIPMYISVSGVDINFHAWSTDKTFMFFGRDGIIGDISGDGNIDYDDMSLYDQFFYGFDTYNHIYADSGKINFSRGCSKFQWPNEIDATALNLWLNNNYEPLVQDFHFGEKYSDYPMSPVYFHNYSITENNVMVIEAEGNNVFSVVGKFPNGERWQKDLINENTLQLPEGITSLMVAGNRISNSLVTKLEEEKTISSPSNFSLSQNYPNPFNPSTTISFSLAEADVVSLKVYDVLGREVATVVNEYLSAGNYSQIFNAAGLASGQYVYRLQCGKYSETKKMILLK